MTLDPLVRRARLGAGPGRAAGRHRRLHPEAAARAGGRLPRHARGGGRGRPAAARDGRLRRGHGGARGARCRRCSTRSAPASGPRIVVLEQDRPVSPARAPQLQAARPGSVVVSARDRRGPRRPAARHRAAARSRSRRRVRLRFRPRDARGIAGVYTAGRVVVARGRRRRGHASRPRSRSGCVERYREHLRLRRGRGRRGRRGRWRCVAAAAAPRRAARRRAARRRPVREADDYVFPRWPPGELTPRRGAGRREGLAVAHGRAGRGRARSDFRDLLRKQPGLVPAETGLGYVRLRQGRARRGGTRRSPPSSAASPTTCPRWSGPPRPRSAPADGEEALAASARARPRWTRPTRPVQPPPGRGPAPGHGAARGGGARGPGRGRPDRAIAEYRSALEAAPEVAGLRLELADLLVERGQADGRHRASSRPTPRRTARSCCAWASCWPAAGSTAARSRPTGASSPATRRTRRRCAGRARRARRSSCSQMPEEYRRIAGVAADHARRPGRPRRRARSRRSPARPPGRAEGGGRHLGLVGARPHHQGPGPRHHRRLPEPHVPAGGDRAPRGPGAGGGAGPRPPAKWPAGAGASPHRHDARATCTTTPRRASSGPGSWTSRRAGAFEAWRPVSGQEAVDVLEGLIRLVGP